MGTGAVQFNGFIDDRESQRRYYFVEGDVSASFTAEFVTAQHARPDGAPWFAQDPFGKHYGQLPDQQYRVTRAGKYAKITNSK